ncbi:ABC transporter ATP-binding protein [Uliginosibacterium gangwonense]|uniref:ABC transporter ATP-binding protein n=1 Tax=Uliginosibacterium gangwonense TaxID=392736 RepID=UPI0003640673|nr:ATP-binding cassette domain-containing protein [Uliginosibacterium gangwonense]
MHNGALKVRDLRFRFPAQETDLFHIESLDLAHGRSLGIRGPSGAGKTTLLHCLAGIEPAQAGNIEWGTENISRLDGAALTHWRQQKLGLVFQDFHLVEGLSAFDNILLPVSFSGWRVSPALRERAHQLLERVGIHTPQRRAELLSRGERQRVAVARALLFSPAVILADEPTASLDPENREIIGALLLDVVREQGATLIAVSHELSLLSRLDEQMELRGGTLVALEAAHV